MKYNAIIINLDILDYNAVQPEAEKTSYSGTVEVKAKIGIDVELKKIKITIELEMRLDITDDSSTFKSVGKIKTQSIFKLIDNDWNLLVTMLDSEPSLDNGLEDFLVNIAYNNTRGLLRERGKNDLFGKIVLPLLDPKSINR